jgi:hypothetical protein
MASLGEQNVHTGPLNMIVELPSRRMSGLIVCLGCEPARLHISLMLAPRGGQNFLVEAERKRIFTNPVRN